MRKPANRARISDVLRLSANMRLAVAAGLLLAAVGCQESTPPAPTQSDANPVNPVDPPKSQEQARVAQAAAFRAGVEPPAPALQLKGGELATPEVLAAYNQELARLMFKTRDVPETLDELVRKWPLPKLPTPPPGKRIVYDDVNRIIRLEPP